MQISLAHGESPYTELEPSPPERSLIAAVFYRAVEDLLDRTYAESAYCWFHYKGPAGDGFTFRECCEVLHLSPHIILDYVNELYDWAKEERARTFRARQKIMLKDYLAIVRTAT